MAGFTVIIPNYNHARYLAQRINSVLHQNFSDFELIIIDDGSSDDSRAIIEGYRSDRRITHIVFNEKNSGSPFRPWKKGIELAGYDWIWIAESDDFAEPSFLEEAANSIKQYPDTGIFYSDSFILQEAVTKPTERFSARKNEGFHTQKWNHPYYSRGIDEINECLKFGCTINNVSSMIFRKDLFSRDPDQLDGFSYFGDWYFVLKAALSANISYSPRALNHYRKHPDSHLHRETSILIEKKEYFDILKLLYDSSEVRAKTNLLDHFAYHYLGFGLVQDGLKKGIQILRSYFRTDRKLAFKVMTKIASNIIFRKKRAFFVPDK
jgi:glycosyltransferase involved in cell wall biosynthesis